MSIAWLCGLATVTRAAGKRGEQHVSYSEVGLQSPRGQAGCSSRQGESSESLDLPLGIRWLRLLWTVTTSTWVSLEPMSRESVDLSYVECY